MKKVIIYLIGFFLSILVADAQPAVTANLGKLTLQVGTYTSVIPAGSSMNVIGFTLSEKVSFQATASLTNIYIPGIWKIPESGGNYAFTGVGNTITATMVAGEYRMMVMNTSGTGGVVSINLTAVATPQFPSENSFSSDRNYIITSTPQKEKTTASFDINEEVVTVQYFDGLGRPVQAIQRGATPKGADLVTYQEYDPSGREERSWLPAVASGNNGAYMPLPNYKTQAMSTYNNTTYNTAADSIAYSRPVYETSPLNRVLEQYGPGVDWKTNKRAIKTGYLTNIAKSSTTWADSDSLVCGLYKTTDDKKAISLSRAANYGAGELYVTRMKDENENISYEFKNKLGQVILTRQINSGKLYDTNYIYDSFGNLRAVLPPEASDRLLSSSSWTETDTNLKLYAYLYKYDSRNRCIAKKLPGCEWIYYVYDKADRLIFTQDGEQRGGGKNEWLFSIPDGLGRVVLTGICKDTISISNKVVKGVYISTGSYKRYNIQVDGVTKTFTNTPSILTANYYDNYDFRGMAEVPTTNTEYNAETGYGSQYTGGYKGQLTGTLVAQQLSNGTISPTYLYSVMYYDNRGRLIQTKSNNYLAGGLEIEYIAYDFTGKPSQKKHVHQATGKTTQTEVYVYTYDHVGRLLSTTHQLNGGQVINLSENTYDELGRLYTNKKGGVGSTATTYKYNIRSWTKSITSSLFSQMLYYNDIYGGSKAQYNGNISAMSWTQSNETNPRGYAFAYDNLSRLTSANYLINGSTSANNDYKIEKVAYDKHGNITQLQRYGKKDAGTSITSYGLVDNLTLTYSGNQMIHVADAAATFSYIESADFKDKASTVGTIEYTYNTNGAMNSDLNKGITEIQYNSLNLPRQMVINSPTVKAKNYYTYTASGVKLKTEQRYDPNYSVIPSNTTNPSNDGLVNYKNTDYAGNMIYETEKNSAGVVSKIRILVDGGYIEDGVYYYYITDHLGNNRVVVNAVGTVIQRNHYYPFGTLFAEKYDDGKKQPYKYNGKELDQMHGLNLYDYSARYYESAVGRFTSVDPLAEKYYNISPYTYVANNPIKYVDLKGDSLTLYGQQDHIDQVSAVHNSYLDGYYTFSAVRGSKTSLVATNKDRTTDPTAFAKAKTYFDELNAVVNGTEGTAYVRVVSNSENALVGNFNDAMIDIGDIQQLPLIQGNNIVTQGSTLIHETVEQYQTQVMGQHNYANAHQLATTSESNIIGVVINPNREINNISRSGPATGFMTTQASDGRRQTIMFRYNNNIRLGNVFR